VDGKSEKETRKQEDIDAGKKKRKKDRGLSSNITC
jgi:hypothetical protein